MSEYVWLTVTGEQTHPDGTAEKNTSRSRARHEILSDGSHVLISEESLEDTGKTVTSRIVVSDHRITVEKTGDYASRMVFETGLSHSLEYRTPYGTLPMTIETSHVMALAVNENLHARAKYDLIYQAGEPVRCSVTIRTEKIPQDTQDGTS
jgi:uncharacterized beta-barrel protein YwiB (DUF1934 family)